MVYFDLISYSYTIVLSFPCSLCTYFYFICAREVTLRLTSTFLKAHFVGKIIVDSTLICLLYTSISNSYIYATFALAHHSFSYFVSKYRNTHISLKMFSRYFLTLCVVAMFAFAMTACSAEEVEQVEVNDDVQARNPVVSAS